VVISGENVNLSFLKTLVFTRVFLYLQKIVRYDKNALAQSSAGKGVTHEESSGSPLPEAGPGGVDPRRRMRPGRPAHRRWRLGAAVASGTSAVSTAGRSPRDR